MGTKDKFWYRYPEKNERWLFKYPRENTGEHWAEKVAAEIAKALNISHAEVELAEVDGVRGSTTLSFRQGSTTVLRHGNDLLEMLNPKYDRDKRFHQREHNIDNIWEVLELVYLSRIDLNISNESKPTYQYLMAEYLVLDALIGNTDRHHENWGIVVEISEPMRLTPSFDHASSLGRELLDPKRKMWLSGGQIKNYATRARGGIYWSTQDKKAPSPLELVRRSVKDSRYRKVFVQAIKKLSELDRSSVCDIVNRVPARWMSPTAKEFAIELVNYNTNQLIRSIQE